METPANETLAKMAVQDFFGGKFVLTPMDSRRINQLRTYDMVAGDILVWEEFKGDCQVAIFDGQTLLYPTGNGTLKAMEQVDLDRFLIFRFFICLRPTQAL